MGLLLFALRRQRIVSRARQASPTSPQGPQDPRQRLAKLSVDVRLALSGNLGPNWTSLTTEEIAAHPAITNDPQAPRLRAFLRAADRAKFADNALDADSLEDWESWVAAYLAPTRVNP